MWKKLHSNRDPGVTLLGEIKREFKPYFAGSAQFISDFLSRNPKTIFSSMTAVLVCSIVLSFTMLKYPKNIEPLKKQESPFTDGMNAILSEAGKLKTTIQLRQAIDSVSRRKVLSGKDSAFLDSALDKLHILNPLK